MNLENFYVYTNLAGVVKIKVKVQVGQASIELPLMDAPPELVSLVEKFSFPIAKKYLDLPEGM